MRIAFTSCFSAQSFRDQPAWDQILDCRPDHLVLLGDSAYYDADGSSMGAVKGMTANDFAIHAFSRLRDQLNQPQFARLVGQPWLTTHAIWDDHDFLWNGACGAQIGGQPDLAPLIPPTRAAFQAYRRALARRDPASFPANPPNWPNDAPEPGYSKVVLAPGLILHLTDGRSYKTRLGKRAIYGPAQMAQLENEVRAARDAVHLIASGVVFERREGETWLDCMPEHDQLLALAASHKVLVLSGDIHDNRFASYKTAGAWPMYEATASGAALQTAVTVGELRCNWCLLDIDDAQISISHFQIGVDPQPQVIQRASWTLKRPG